MSTALRLSVEEYETMIANGGFAGLERRLEFIEGEIRQMSPAGPVHDEFIDILNEWSFENGAATDFRVRIQAGLLVHQSIPEPDLMWLTNRSYAFNRPSAADAFLVIEVAESSLEYDLGEKAQLYARGGIREYWVVDIPDRRLHRHLRPSSSGYHQITIDESDQIVSPSFRPNALLALAKLFS